MARRLGQAVIGQLQQQKYKLTYPHPDDTRWTAADFAARVYTQEPDLIFRITMVDPPTQLEWNAFALPGGHVLAFTTLRDILSPEEMSAVLAHEIGHVKYRHGMQRLAKGVGLLAIATLTVGDFSAVASSLAVGVRTLAYTREMEEEADRYAVNLLKQLQIPPERLGQALAAIEAAAHAKPTTRLIRRGWVCAERVQNPRVQAKVRAPGAYDQASGIWRTRPSCRARILPNNPKDLCQPSESAPWN
jgi:Zn-dependent protease with chaperone function